MKLQSKITLTVVPLIVLPLCAVGILAYIELWNHSAAQSKQQIQGYLHQLTDDYLNQIRDAEITLESLANDSLLKDYLLTADEEYRYRLMQRPLLRKLANYQQANPALYELRVLMADGFEELRSSNQNISNHSEDEYRSAFFVSALKQRDQNDSFVGINPDNGELALFVTRPVKLRQTASEGINREATLRGLLSATQSIEDIGNHDLPPPWDQGHVMLTNALGKHLHGQHALSQTPHWCPDNLIPRVDGRWHTIELDARQFLHFSQQLGPNLYLQALLPQQAIHASSRKVGSIIISMMVLTLIVAIPFILFLLHRQILAPIQSLNRAFDDFGSKRQRVEVPKLGSDEIGELCQSFNQMSQQLDDSHRQIHQLAYRDSLTGLSNRASFLNKLDRALERAKPQRKPLALLFLDLDNFKPVNDNLGHQAGDQLLQMIAQRLRQNLRDSDQLTLPGTPQYARLGGDEFTVLLPVLDEPEQAGIVAQRIIELITQPFQINEQAIYIGTSIGIAVFPKDAHSADELISHADVAMYQAKKSGKNCYRYFSHHFNEEVRQQADLEQRLHRAVEQQAFEVHYQPILELSNRDVYALEALIRWNDQELGSVPPGRFIPIAEQSGLIVPIGLWVLEEVSRQQRAWLDAGYPPTKVGINLSALELAQKNFVGTVRRLLEKYRITPDQLYFELTETAVMNNARQVIRNLKGLSRIGIHIALDDFGTGYSSLSYLKILPIDILKIDRSFIMHLSEDNNCVILEAVVSMAHALGLKVVAEGVEVEEHLHHLERLGCDRVQGYLFSAAKPPEKAIALLHQFSHPALSGQPQQQPDTEAKPALAP